MTGTALNTVFSKRDEPSLIDMIHSIHSLKSYRITRQSLDKSSRFNLHTLFTLMCYMGIPSISLFARNQPRDIWTPIVPAS